MHKSIPKSQLAIFPNTDHVVLMINPDTNKVLPEIKEFLNSDSAKPSLIVKVKTLSDSLIIFRCGGYREGIREIV